MKNLKSILFAALALSLAVPAQAQTALTSTTLSAAITDTSSQFISVSSATGFAAQSKLYVDRELMTILSVNGTLIRVARGSAGMTSQHANSSTVYVGIAPYFTTVDRVGACTRTNEVVLPILNVNNGDLFDCFGSVWYRRTVGAAQPYTISVAPGAQPAAATPVIGTAMTITGQPGGAQSATTSNGAAGAAVNVTAGIGGVGGTSTGTGGAGGALALTAGAGAGTITGGAGGAASLIAGAGANGTSAGGTGGALTIGSGAAGTGGTGTVGAVAVKSGATSVFSTSTAGATSVLSSGTNQSVTLTPSGSGAIQVTGGTDPTKIVKIDASGLTTAVTNTLAFGATTSKTTTFPDITGTVPTIVSCGATSTGTANCANTSAVAVPRVYFGTATLSSNAQVITFGTAFTSTATYSCVANDITTRANPVQMVQTSASTATITNTTGGSDAINYICVGY